MRNWVRNRWLDTTLKFLAVYAIIHIIALIIGAFTGPNIGLFGWSTLWNHWTNATVLNYVLAILGSIILFFIIYYFFSNDREISKN